MSDEFFKELEPKYLHNLKNMSSKLLYDISVIYIKLNRMNDMILETVIHSLLKNDNINKDINSYKIFTENDINLIFDFIVVFSKSNEKITNSFYKIIAEYTYKSINKFDGSQVLELFKILDEVKYI